MALRKRLRIDDVVDAFAVHGGSGAWGCLALGLFERHAGLLTSGSARLLSVQALGCVVLIALAALPTLALTLCLRYASVKRAYVILWVLPFAPRLLRDGRYPTMWTLCYEVYLTR